MRGADSFSEGGQFCRAAGGAGQGAGRALSPISVGEGLCQGSPRNAPSPDGLPALESAAGKTQPKLSRAGQTRPNRPDPSPPSPDLARRRPAGLHSKGGPRGGGGGGVSVEERRRTKPPCPRARAESRHGQRCQASPEGTSGERPPTPACPFSTSEGGSPGERGQPPAASQEGPAALAAEGQRKAGPALSPDAWLALQP